MEAVERQIGRKRDIAQVFGVHESFLYKRLRQKRERGTIAPLPHGGGVPAQLSAAQLQQLAEGVVAPPEATLEELREQLRKTARVRVSLTTVWRGVQTVGVSRKKRRSAPAKLRFTHARPSTNSSRADPVTS